MSYAIESNVKRSFERHAWQCPALAAAAAVAAAAVAAAVAAVAVAVAVVPVVAAAVVRLVTGRRWSPIPRTSFLSKATQSTTTFSLRGTRTPIDETVNVATRGITVAQSEMEFFIGIFSRCFWT